MLPEVVGVIFLLGAVCSVTAQINYKPGSCPMPYSTQNMNSNKECAQDSDCPGFKKCCPLGWYMKLTCTDIEDQEESYNSMYQQVPMIPQGLWYMYENYLPQEEFWPSVKSGLCPKRKSKICFTGCFDDYDCPAKLKCCDTGCGKLCTYPQTVY